MELINYNIAHFRNELDLVYFLDNLLLSKSNFINRSITKLSFFLNINNNQVFFECVNNLSKRVELVFGHSQKCIPAVSFISQPPANCDFCIVEILSISNTLLVSPLSYIANSANQLLKANTVFGNYYFSSMSKSSYSKYNTTAEHIYHTIDFAFSSLKMNLDFEHLDFGSVIRQWTYIEKVLNEENYDNGLKQFYQVFNDVRSLYFENNSFPNGYMSATGIGANAGIISTEIIAFKPTSNSNSKIYPISNPKQINSYNYSQGKLIGTPISKLSQKTTPKFERAKLLIHNNFVQLYISGTASVLGEDTVQINNTFEQTRITLANIDLLIKQSNSILSSYSSSLSNSDIVSARIYLKNKNDLEIVQSLCSSYFITKELIFIQANICRDDLLVEIEAYLEKEI